MKSWIGKLFNSATALPEAKPKTDWDLLQTQTCPACRTHPIKLYEGPSGGMSTNVFCNNCGQGYNLTPMIEIAERISVNMAYCDNEQVKARYALQQQFAPRTTFAQLDDLHRKHTKGIT